MVCSTLCGFTYICMHKAYVYSIYRVYVHISKETRDVRASNLRVGKLHTQTGVRSAAQHSKVFVIPRERGREKERKVLSFCTVAVSFFVVMDYIPLYLLYISCTSNSVRILNGRTQAEHVS